MRGHGVAELVDNVDTSIYRRIEAERIVRIFEVVIDSSGNSYRRNSVLLGKALCASERTVAAYNHKPLDTSRFERFNRLSLPRFREHFKAPCSPQLRAAALHDIRNGTHFHLYHFIVYKTLISAFDTVYFHTVIKRRTDNRPYACVHTGSVAAAG